MKQGRVFIPSRVADNPSLDADEYLATLVHLPPLARERLARGDWGVQEQGQFRPEWLRYYVDCGHLAPRDANDAQAQHSASQLELLDSARSLLVVIPPGACRRFATVDPAGTAADVMREERGRAPSHTVVQVWDQPRRAELAHFLMLRHQVRQRVAFDGLCQIIREVHREWQPERIWIEDEKFGTSAVSILAKEGLPIEVVRTGGKDKLARAAWLTNKMSRGEVFLPRYDNAWRLDFEAELLAWTGHDDQPSDQIDAAAYAAIIASRDDRRPIRIERVS